MRIFLEEKCTQQNEKSKEKKILQNDWLAKRDSCEVNLYFSKSSERLADHFSSKMVF